MYAGGRYIRDPQISIRGWQLSAQPQSADMHIRQMHIVVFDEKHADIRLSAAKFPF
jgi:hypothetical protein